MNPVEILPQGLCVASWSVLPISARFPFWVKLATLVQNGNLAEMNKTALSERGAKSRTPFERRLA